VKTVAVKASVAVLALMAARSAHAQIEVPGDPFQNDPTGIVADPCPQHSGTETKGADPAVMQLHGFTRDFAGLCVYRVDDAKLKAAGARPSVVFIGDSITWLWKETDPNFFPQGIVVDRGISGQTTPQMLVRFRNDVVDLHPQVVHILAGTNDIAGNTGPATLETIEGNIASMAELARTNGIKVIIGSVTPAGQFGWRKTIPHPAETIAHFDAWLKDYASRNGFIYVDYHAALAAPDGSMKAGLSLDGVHPSPKGFAVMEALAKPAIALALSMKR